MGAAGNVSVIMTCHNEAAFIEQAIRSVTAQTAYGRVSEIIVVNDGSSDQSQSILEGLADEIGKLKILRASGIGPSAARNMALAEASGAFIAVLDGDDIWAPRKLELQLPRLESDDRIGLVYSDFYDFSDAGVSDAKLFQVRRYMASDPNLLERFFVRGGPVIPSSTVYRREVFEKAGLFNTELRLAEDSDMVLRIAQDWSIQYVPGGLVYKRRHGRNASRDMTGWEAAAERVAGLAVARVPRLAGLQARRKSYRHSKIASAYLSEGLNLEGWRYLLGALRLDPFNRRAYAIAVLALFPSGLRKGVSRWVKRVQAMAARRGEPKVDEKRV